MTRRSARLIAAARAADGAALLWSPGPLTQAAAGHAAAATHAGTTTEAATASVYQDRADPEEIQRRIRRYREHLLAGRGPGASPEETAPQMRDRQWLGGVPAAVARQHEADQATLAGGDPPAVEDVIIRQRAELSITLAALREHLHSLRTRAVTGLRRSLIAAAAGAAAALAAQARLRRLNRHTPRSWQPVVRAVRAPQPAPPGRGVASWWQSWLLSRSVRQLKGDGRGERVPAWWRRESHRKPARRL